MLESGYFEKNECSKASNKAIITKLLNCLTWGLNQSLPLPNKAATNDVI